MDDSSASFDIESLARKQRLLLSRFALAPYDAALDPLPRSAGFDSLFDPVGLLELSDSLLFNELVDGEVNSEGELIAADSRANRAYLFGTDGGFKRELDPTLCHPEFSGIPWHVDVDADDRILMLYMGSRAAFRFEADGSCIGPVDLGEFNPQSITMRDGTLYAFRINRDGWRVWTMTDTTKTTLFSGSEYARMNNGYLSTTGDIFALADSALGVVFRHSPYVWRLSLRDGSVTPMGTVPPDFLVTEEDIPPGAQTDDEVNEARSRIWEGKSRTWGYYRIADDLLIIYHINRNEPFATSESNLGMRIMDHQGRTIHKDPITMKGYMTRFVAARDGLFFRVLTEYRDEDERLSRNPPILVYRLRLENLGEPIS